MMTAVGFRTGNFVETTGAKVLLAGVKEWRLMLKDVEEGGVLFLDEGVHELKEVSLALLLTLLVLVRGSKHTWLEIQRRKCRASPY
jgi:hypothetical protein